jgi:hypothetical protein
MKRLHDLKNNINLTYNKTNDKYNIHQTGDNASAHGFEFSHSYFLASGSDF